ncbi:MAG: flagellar biosynthesis protein FlhA [Polyangiales bacterium]
MQTVSWGMGATRRSADVALAAVVLLVVGMMIVPLPTHVLDVLLAANIALSVLLLLVAMYVGSGLELTSFPTLLLVTTLYRLALNVSSTRLVLLQADAGEVIRSFGDFVVRGNYVVGGVVFFLLTLIQFLVIAKGSERVAEVGARFTLDAMPGKQMSIDAELRSGALTQDEARAKRALLHRESQFYGAMDGAMKFVKGDAIAGIVITLVNILGGLAIGVAMRDLTVGESLRTYGLLTIGDGLVSQIPALLLSTSAGLVVTRVASEDAEGSLGMDVAKQVFGRPRALLVAGGFLLLLAIVPGLPGMPFLVLGALFLVLGARLSKAEAARARSGAGDGSSRLAPGRGDAVFLPLVVPIALELGPEVAKLLVEGDAPVPELTDGLATVRERIFASLGAPVPSARVRTAPALAPSAYVLSIQEVPVVEAELPAGSTREAALSAMLPAIEDALARRAPELFGLQEAQGLVDRLERAYPALVRHVVPKPLALPALTDVLRRLLEEGVSIRPLREILESLAHHAPLEKDPVELTELVRSSLRRALTHRHARGGTLPVFLLDPAIEETVRDAIQRTATGSYLALAPDLARDLLDAARRTLAAHPQRAPIVLTQPDVRRYVFRLLEHEVPGLVVLSYAELVPDVVVTPVDRIRP